MQLFSANAGSVGLLCGVLALAGCASGPRVDSQRSAFWIWHSQGSWHLAVSTGGQAHRYQGTITAHAGGVRELVFSDPQLKDYAALVKGNAQFDFERTQPVRMDLKASGRGCASFDLYLDGKRQPERVYFGTPALSPASLPIMLCPAR